MWQARQVTGSCLLYTSYTLFDSFQIKYVTDLTEPQKYVSLLTIRTKDGADPKEVANTINTKTVSYTHLITTDGIFSRIRIIDTWIKIGIK